VEIVITILFYILGSLAYVAGILFTPFRLLIYALLATGPMEPIWKAFLWFCSLFGTAGTSSVYQ